MRNEAVFPPDKNIKIKPRPVGYEAWMLPQYRKTFFCLSRSLFGKETFSFTNLALDKMKPNTNLCYIFQISILVALVVLVACLSN